MFGGEGRGNGGRSFDSDSESEDAPSSTIATTVVAVPSTTGGFSFGSPSTASTTEAPQQSSGFSFASAARTNQVVTFGSSNVSGNSFGVARPAFGATTSPTQTSAGFGSAAPAFGATQTSGIFNNPTRGFGAPASTSAPAAANPFARATGFTGFNQVPRAAEAAQATGGFGSPQPAGGFGNPQPAGGFGAANNAFGGNQFGAARANPFGNAFGLGFGKESPAIRHQRIRSSLFQFMSELSKESDCDNFSALLEECIAVTSAVKVSYYLRASFADIHFYNLGWSCKT